jgi:GNAT superfamily N-acetyltransferase
MRSTADFTVRRAGPSDAAALAQLRYEFRAEIERVVEAQTAFLERCRTWMAARLREETPWRCWVAEVDHVIRATAWLQVIEKIPNPVAEPERHGYVSSLYVQRHLRTTGVGSTLLTECLRACDAERVDAVILWPTPRSRTLYARHGFGVRGDLMERRLAAVQP